MEGGVEDDGEGDEGCQEELEAYYAVDFTDELPAELVVEFGDGWVEWGVVEAGFEVAFPLCVLRCCLEVG